MADLVAWSLRASAAGVWPTKGFYGETFAEKTMRSKHAGKELAGGFRFPVTKTFC